MNPSVLEAVLSLLMHAHSGADLCTHRPELGSETCSQFLASQICDQTLGHQILKRVIPDMWHNEWPSFAR